jgi:hypothetical protein
MVNRLAGQYYDYCDPKAVTWSGWGTSYKDLSKYVTALAPSGGGEFPVLLCASKKRSTRCQELLNILNGCVHCAGDAPEAAKTAIWELLKHVDKPTVVIWYADAPPHHKTTA